MATGKPTVGHDPCASPLRSELRSLEKIPLDDVYLTYLGNLKIRVDVYHLKLITATGLPSSHPTTWSCLSVGGILL